jgi:hypothetical protein
MKKTALVAASLVSLSAFAQDWRVTSDQSVGGWQFPESVGCDVKNKVLYVGNFGGQKLAPAEKDGLGYISKVGADGKVIDKQWFPPAGGEKMNKPKGIWIESGISGGRLWTTDIDGVWIIDLKTKKGRKAMIPGAQFANDPAVLGKALYVTDNRSDQLFRIEPADFLNSKSEPKTSVVYKGGGLSPNGIYPGRDGRIYFGGFAGADKPRGIYALAKDGTAKAVTHAIGRIDGLYQMKDGSLLATDWGSSSLFRYDSKNGYKELAKGFKGPADFCVMPGEANSMTVVVPDLPTSQVRFIQLRKG